MGRYRAEDLEPGAVSSWPSNDDTGVFVQPDEDKQPMRIGEVLVLNRSVSKRERRGVERFFREHYGIKRTWRQWFRELFVR